MFQASSFSTFYRAANHYDFCGIITIFCSSLRPYSENCDKSAYPRNTIDLVPYDDMIWCSSDTVLTAHCITRLACMLIFRGVYTMQAVPCSAYSLYGAHHTAVGMAWKPLLCQRIRMVHYFQESPGFCGDYVFYLCRISSLFVQFPGHVDFVFGLVSSLKH